ncbi:MAG: TetR/AcrR family transcriptional regulator [Propionicimonas sp.]|jgi:AcrR family transcriptional regulator
MVETTRHAQAAREAILNAAADLIRTEGAAGMSIADLIARSGTSAGAIYHHFGSKQGVVLEVARRAVAGPMQSVLHTPTEGGLSPADLLTAALTRVVQATETAELIIQIWAGASAKPELGELLRSEGQGVRDMVELVVSHWCELNDVDADPAGVSAVLLSLVMGSVVQQSLVPDFDAERYLAAATTMLASLTESTGGDGDPS